MKKRKRQKLTWKKYCLEKKTLNKIVEEEMDKSETDD